MTPPVSVLVSPGEEARPTSNPDLTERRKSLTAASFSDSAVLT